MSFGVINRHRVAAFEEKSVSKQLNRSFIVLKTRMNLPEYEQYIKDLDVEATDYWYCRFTPHSIARQSVCTFAFISDIDAMAFKLRWG